MSEFCKACAKEMGFPNDFKGLTTKSDWHAGRAVNVICEGCGLIQVDPDGNCVTSECLEKGRPGHGMPWYEQLPQYLERRDAEGAERFRTERPQSVFSFGPTFHTWWFVGTSKPVPSPCQRGCTVCGPYWC